MKTLKIIALNLLGLVLFPTMIVAETIGVFFDSSIEQIKFAAGDVKTALEGKNFTVEMLPLSSLNGDYANKKVVVTIAGDNTTSGILTSQGGTTPTSLKEQGYGLRTTTQGQTSYWVFGGDANGAMYGGLQIAENISFYGFGDAYNLVDAPKIAKRGIKLNLPFDAKSPTYFSSNNSTASRNAIANVWDITFWEKWFDEMARYRYNILSVWNNHPFTSMIKLPDYPNVALANVTGYANIYNDNDNTGTLIKTMTIDQKIEFWKKVMKYAKDRGFSFYLINWNVFLSNAKNQYGMTDGSAGVTNQATIDYLRKCMYELLKTYPDLDGFGVTEGEGMSDNDENNSAFLGNSYGKGMADFAKDNPNRKLNFIHRWHMADFTLIKKNFAELLSLPNVTLDMSFKYSSAHMYSSSNPLIFSQTNINALVNNNLKTWFTVRNDDFYYHNWGDPNFARAYINNIPGQGEWFNGFYIGSDGFHQTRTFFSKNSVTQGQLEIQRLWYMNMIWGRMAYNSTISDDVFINYMKLKYPEVNATNINTAWRKASSGLPKVGEIIFSSLNLDFHWYPENCQSKDGFLTIAHFAAASTRAGSNLCDIMNSASNTCSGKISTYEMTNQIEADALDALAIVEPLQVSANTELGVAINNIKAMSYLTIYYANKIRGATYSKAVGKQNEAIDALGKAYCWWKKYTNLMDANFTGMTCQRTAKFETWHQHDAAVLKEYTDMGGTGTPNCGVGVRYNIVASSNDITKGTVSGAGQYTSGDNVEIKAIPNIGFRFQDWKENNEVVSKDMNFKFIVKADKNLVANFIDANGCELPWTSTDITVNNTTITDRSLGLINATCSSTITISADVEGLGGLDPTDYCRIYYKINGGTPQPLFDIINIKGAIAKQTYTKTVTANSIELILNSLNTANDEIYKITNIKMFAGPTAIENIDFSKSGIQGMTVYPNPATNVLNVDFQTEDSNRKIEIFNALGQLIYKTKVESLKNKLDLKAFNLEGVVTIQVISGEKQTNLRVLVK